MTVERVSAFHLFLADTPQGIEDPAYTRFLEIYRAFHLFKDYFEERNNLFLLNAAAHINPLSFVSLAPAGVSLASALSLSSRASGFSSESIKPGQSGKIDFSSSIQAGFSSLSTGSVYFLDTSPGLITLTPPVAPGTIVQEVGLALSTSELLVKISTPVVN